jgi:DNA modification methylase
MGRKSSPRKYPLVALDLRANDPILDGAATRAEADALTYEIKVGNCLHVLKGMPENSIHCAITSPPYWGLRDYGVPPEAWGGDPTCPHVWGEMQRGKRTDILPEDQTTLKSRTSVNEKQNGANTNGGRFCLNCDAWLGCYGLEPTPELYAEHTVLIFREVRRVLRKDGTLWLNIGDSYAAGGRGAGRNERQQMGEATAAARALGAKKAPPGYKNKDLIGIPWLVAGALRADGWYLRAGNVWWKKNPMPESTTDRTTAAHEFMFHFSKSESYYYDHEAIKEEIAASQRGRIRKNDPVGGKSWKERGQHSEGGAITTGPIVEEEPEAEQGNLDDDPSAPKKQDGHGRRHKGFNKRWDESGDCDRRNKRSVWHIESDEPTVWRFLFENAPDEETREKIAILFDEWSRQIENRESVWIYATMPYAEAHFATMPPALVEPCLLAGTSLQNCETCGAPWERVTEEHTVDRTELPPDHPEWRPRKYDYGKAADPVGRGIGRRYRFTDTTGWTPTCKCAVNTGSAKALVLDPFGGSGTTAMVADGLGRDAVIIELNPEYAEMAERRISRGHQRFQPTLL